VISELDSGFNGVRSDGEVDFALAVVVQDSTSVLHQLLTLLDQAVELELVVGLLADPRGVRVARAVGRREKARIAFFIFQDDRIIEVQGVLNTLESSIASFVGPVSGMALATAWTLTIAVKSRADSSNT
jgi:hypothetical protein